MTTTQERPAPAALFRQQTGVALRQARVRAGLTIDDVAWRSGMPVQLVERAEAGELGDLTLQQFLDLAGAAGHVPLDISLIPLDEAEAFATEHQRTPSITDFEAWRARRAVRQALEAAGK